jgi:hypothetical protein
MQKYRCIQRRRAVFHLIDWLVIVFFIIVWLIDRKPVATGRVISYVKAPGHILVQLIEPFKLTKTGIQSDPQWTLYGDGTLIFKADPSDTYWRAQLTGGDIQHILNVIINQDTFFGHTQQRYGNIASARDDDDLLLTVNANGQQKGVMLVSKPTKQVASDIQTNRLFAIEQFLLSYQPVSAVFYAPDPASDHDSDDGP